VLLAVTAEMNREDAKNAKFSLFFPRLLSDLGVLAVAYNAQSRNNTQEGDYQIMHPPNNPIGNIERHNL
jgi:hypothetical protein